MKGYHYKETRTKEQIAEKNRRAKANHPYNRRKNPVKYYAADTETTVEKDPSVQKSTRVWLVGHCEVGESEEVVKCTSLRDWFDIIDSIPVPEKGKKVFYFHNLKFDGEFILWHLIHEMNARPVYEVEKDYSNLEYNDVYSVISAKGQWYDIVWRGSNGIIEFRDSLKLLPFSIKKIGKDFGTKHRKLTMDYEDNEDRRHYEGMPLSEIPKEELDYFDCDILVLKEALKIMFDEGHESLTIGSCCMKEYRKYYDKEIWNNLFPNLTSDNIFAELGTNTEWFCRKAYRGGWCFVKEAGKYGKGCTFDVNSLYPSVMWDENNRYPVGKPLFAWKGEIPDNAKAPDKYYFVKIRCRFQVKPDHLPFIQIKGNVRYKSTECLTTSDVKIGGKYYRYYKDIDGQVAEAKVELYLTCKDYELFHKQYDVFDEEVIGGVCFRTMDGHSLFGLYIGKYARIKKNSKGAKRTLAKLFLNNLYGKFSTSPDASFKAYGVGEDGVMAFEEVGKYDESRCKYIPIGAAITSYAKIFTITAAQNNYEHFIYADTDSIHCWGDPEDIKDIPIDANEFNHWKCESCWDMGLFVRQKTYVEHITHEDFEPVEPYYNVKAAGMPDACKNLFLRSTEDGQIHEDDEPEFKKLLKDPVAQEYLKTHRTIDDFKIGMVIPVGKLRPKVVEGGVVLVPVPFTMKA